MKARLGGLARRATYIESIRKESAPILHFDAGDAFQSKYEVTDAERPSVMAMAEVFLAAFQKMGLNAYNIGDRDLALGLDTLKGLAKKAKFPFLSANIRAEDGSAVFEPSVVLRAAGLKVGVIGVITMVFVNKNELSEKHKIRFENPADAVAREVARRKAEGVDFFVVLGHLNESEIESVAKKNPEVKFVLGGQSMNMESTLSQVEGVFSAGAYMRGKNLSVLDLYVKNGSMAFVDRYGRRDLEKKKMQLELQIKARERMAEQTKAAADPGGKARQQAAEQALAALRTQHQEVVMAIEDAAAPDKAASFVSWELLPVDTRYADEPGVQALVDDYRKVYPDPTKVASPPPPPTPPAPGATDARIIEHQKVAPRTPERRAPVVPSGAARVPPAARR